MALYFLTLLLLPLASALNNGVAITPSMGWNPYNAFLCDTTEAQYKTAADKLISLGLSTLGYKYVNLDCGWQGKTRNSTGGFTWDNTTIPSGIPALSSYIHDLGLKFGVYSDGGVYACDFVGGTAHYLGSLGHEASDASTFASWGADYLKYDNCYAVNSTDFVDDNPPISVRLLLPLPAHYTTMRDALAATNRPIVFSICEWGVQDPARWPASAVGNSNDIGPPASWDNLFRIINQLVPIAQFAESGAWNDLDMLEVGNTGLSLTEQQTHFTFWAAAKSPLIISTDLSNVSTEALDILKNPRIIALNQDALGKSISFKRRYTNDHDVWAGPLADGSIVAVIINWQSSSRSLTFNLADAGFISATATDLITGAYTAAVPAHGSLVLKLSGGITAPTQKFTYYNAAASSNTLAGGANLRVVNSTVTVVGFVGNGGTLTINNVDGGSDGTKTLSIDYINGDYVFSNTACSNCRNAFIRVNGGSTIQAQMPISAQSWDILFSGYLVSLSGFKPGRNNTITISNPDAFAPDFYRIGVSV
ncbi:glycoside hydrolase family 27 protein [Cyathus striatus]|nr:glycoside hydrolase family 27 protein [Cyathus striatus]